MEESVQPPPSEPVVLDSEKPNHIRVVGALAGIGSGVTKVAVGHGFDTVKTRLQCFPPGTYRGAVDCALKIVRKEGPLALYKGATAPAIGWAAIDSVLLGSLHNYRLFFLNNKIFTEPIPNKSSSELRVSVVGHGVAGLLAGWTSSVLATPMELIKVNLQMQEQVKKADRRFSGPINCMTQIVRTNGPLGLWRGFMWTVAFRSSFAWMFASFELLMRQFAKLDGTRFEMSVGTANFLSGGLGSFSYWLGAMPADVVKNRIMTSPLESRPSPRTVIKKIYSDYGLRGFYKGFGPSILRAFPVNASAFFVYEGLMRLLGAEKVCFFDHSWRPDL